MKCDYHWKVGEYIERKKSGNLVSSVVWICSSLVVCMSLTKYSAGVLGADWVVCAFDQVCIIGVVDVSGFLSMVVCFDIVLLLGGH